MRPEFDICAVFPAIEDANRPTELELTAFAAFWDDRESEEQNLEAIAWWLDQGNHRQPFGDSSGS